MKERIYYFDVAKGILILLLLMSHLGMALKRANIDNSHPFFTFWYYPQPLFIAFYMQCFYIISGYCSSFEVVATVFFKKLAKRLLVPWIFFELVRILFFVIEGDSEELFTAKEFSTLWFLNALIFADSLYWLINRICSKINVVLLLALLLLFLGVVLNQYSWGGINILYYKQGLIACFFVALGNILRKQHNLYRHLLKYSGFIFFLIMLGCFLHIYKVPIQDATINVTLSSIPLFLMTSLTGSFGFLFLCKLISRNRVLEYFGRNSLVVYGLHMLPFVIIVVIINQYIIALSSQMHAIAFVIVTFLAEIVAMFFTIEVLNIKYLRVLIGKF